MKLTCVLGLALVLVLRHQTASAQEPLEGYYAQGRASLTAAGYRPNEVASLISAVYDREDVVHAADAVDAFDGLPDETGAPIDALRLLNDLIAKQAGGPSMTRTIMDRAVQRVQRARQERAARQP